MAEMVCSALVQETVSRGVSFALGKHEEKASQGHLKERLEMAANELELALERSAKLPITDVSLLRRRKMIKRGYVQAMELLDKEKQQVVPAGQELQVAQGVKRPRWNFWAKNMPVTPSATLSTDDVRRFEWFADCAGRFVRYVESGCSLHHNRFCSPIVRHLLEGKTLRYHLKHGNLEQSFLIWPTYSDERGVEAVLSYFYDDSTVTEKNFCLALLLRLSASTDIIEVAIKGLQLLLTTGFKPAAECAIGELALLSNSQDIGHSYGRPWLGSGILEMYIEDTELFRPDPACCKGSRHGLCASNNSQKYSQSKLFIGVFSVPALEPSRSSCSSFDVVGTSSKNTGGGKPPLLLKACFLPHVRPGTQDSYAPETIGDDNEHRYSSLQQVVEALKSDAISCFLRQPERTEYKLFWFSRHGYAWFWVEKASRSRK